MIVIASKNYGNRAVNSSRHPEPVEGREAPLQTITVQVLRNINSGNLYINLIIQKIFIALGVPVLNDL